MTVWINTGGIRFTDRDPPPFDLMAALLSMDRPGMVGSRTEVTAALDPVEGRIRAIRKSEEAIRAHDRTWKKAGKSGNTPNRRPWTTRNT